MYHFLGDHGKKETLFDKGISSGNIIQKVV